MIKHIRTAGKKLLSSKYSVIDPDRVRAVGAPDAKQAAWSLAGAIKVEQLDCVHMAFKDPAG
ncbi:hypothetical protein [Paracoccus actinidiae]|uniref:hypothetical protein n=1 Tax=Paracoccus actinidiae TaxID=3064531 RepID=UPI0027D2D51C|nr:hypothetical protein [Paracoccus sp. M09]